MECVRHLIVGRTPRSAADALVGLLGLNEVEFISDLRVRSTISGRFSALGILSDIGPRACGRRPSMPFFGGLPA